MTEQKTRRYETKFRVERLAFFQGLLAGHFTPDDHFPANRIYNVHFDTTRLDAYQEKRSGDLFKSKIRARWYTAEPTLSLPRRVKVENKRKDDNSIVKQSIEVDLPARKFDDLLDPTFWRPILAEAEAAFGRMTPRPLFPIMVSGYRRIRFVDRPTGARISLDDDISSYAVSPLVNPVRTGHIALRGGVLEVKGETRDLPIALKMSGCLRRSTFSKYAELLGAHLGDMSWEKIYNSF